MYQRLEEFDILKGIGIILVLLGHLPTGDNVHMLIYTFHMPLFFFCSGFFFKKQPLLRQFTKDVKSLLIPYIFFAIILILTLAGMQVYHFRTLFAVTNIKLNPLDSQCYPLYHTIWFLICLFFVRELFNLIYTRKYLITGIFTCLGYVLAQILKYQHFTIPFFIDAALGLMAFYAIGCLFKLTNLYTKRINWYYSLFILLLYLGVMFFIKPQVATRDNFYPWYLFITATIPILALYYLSFEISRCNNKVVRTLKICGASSLFIFALHGPILEVSYSILNKIGCPIAIQTIVLLILIIPTCIAAKKIINEHAPYLIGKF